MITVLLIASGVALLALGGEVLIRGAVGLAHLLRWSPLVIGIIVVGFGTSLAELFVSVDAVILGSPGIAVGNVFGSNISNILVVLALAALIRPVAKPSRLLMPDALVLLPVTIVTVLLGLGGIIATWQAAAMVALLIGLVYLEFHKATQKAKVLRQNGEELELPAHLPQGPWSAAGFVFVGLIGLGAGAELLVEGAIRAARMLGVSEALIGLTIVAVGTSLPELAGAIAASRHGHSKVVYGNVVGSNLFNLLGVLGCAGLAGSLTVSWSLAVFDGSIMVVATAAMILLIWVCKGLGRLEAALLFLAYILYVTVRATLSINGVLDV